LRLPPRLLTRQSPAAQYYRWAVLARPAKPPPYGCFTVPRFQLLPALESLLGLLFANLFWVGLWDLLDNTIFPSENSVQMLSLVRPQRQRSAAGVGFSCTGATRLLRAGGGRRAAAVLHQLAVRAAAQQVPPAGEAGRARRERDGPEAAAAATAVRCVAPRAHRQAWRL
jgi:hypothetical protein